MLPFSMTDLRSGVHGAPHCRKSSLPDDHAPVGSVIPFCLRHALRAAQDEGWECS